MDDSSSYYYTTPIISNTTGYANIYSSTYNGSIYGNTTTTKSGGNSLSFDYPKLSNTILLLKTKPKDEIIFDAELIKKSIIIKYKIK